LVSHSVIAVSRKGCMHRGRLACRPANVIALAMRFGQTFFAAADNFLE
jgi:hypothetical protein